MNASKSHNSNRQTTGIKESHLLWGYLSTVSKHTADGILSLYTSACNAALPFPRHPIGSRRSSAQTGVGRTGGMPTGIKSREKHSINVSAATAERNFNPMAVTADSALVNATTNPTAGR
jgi:hypothetical protein